MNLSNQRIIIIIGGLILLIVILVVSISAIKNRKVTKTDENGQPIALASPTPVFNKQVLGSYKTIDQAPRLLPNEGQGLDVNSPYIVNSAAEIQKITSSLPYSKTFTSSKNIPIDIEIPSAQIMDNKWTLLVNISGIDYQIPATDPKYNDMKLSFIEAAQDVFYWLKSKNVATENIIIEWGDRAFIQQRSAEWLAN